MKYTKPVITVAGEAIRAIQSHSKAQLQVPDNNIDELYESMAAYEADE
jgi:ubiquitin